jgi:hypothetical protein
LRNDGTHVHVLKMFLCVDRRVLSFVWILVAKHTILHFYTIIDLSSSDDKMCFLRFFICVILSLIRLGAIYSCWVCLMGSRPR